MIEIEDYLVHHRTGSAAADSVGEVLARLAELPTDVELIRGLTALDPSEMSTSELLESVRLWERVSWWAQARTWSAIDTFVTAARREPAGVDPVPTPTDPGPTDLDGIFWDYDPHALRDSSIMAEVGLATGLAVESASTRAWTARMMCQRLGATRDAVAAGMVSPWVATLLAQSVEDLDEVTARRVEQLVLPRLLVPFRQGSPRPLPRTRRYAQRIIRRALISADVSVAGRRRRDQESSTAVTLDHGPDGISWLTLRLPAAQGRALYDGCTAAAKARLAVAPGVSMDQARVDALVDAMTSWTDALAREGHLPMEHGRPRVAVQVTVDLATLLGLASNPGELGGYGPIDPDLARDLAADGVWTRWVTDPADGHLIDHGRTRYVPGQRLKDFLRAAYPICSRPGCGRRVRDLDHSVPWSQGGTTSARSMHGVCRRCHRWKTHTGWSTQVDPSNGVVTWTSPHGQVGSLDPPPLPMS